MPVHIVDGVVCDSVLFCFSNVLNIKWIIVTSRRRLYLDSERNQQPGANSYKCFILLCKFKTALRCFRGKHLTSHIFGKVLIVAYVYMSSVFSKHMYLGRRALTRLLTVCNWN